MSIESIAEQYMEDPEDFTTDYCLAVPQIAHKQGKDAALKKLIQQSPKRYVMAPYKHGDKSYDLITRDDKIVLPKALQQKAVD